MTTEQRLQACNGCRVVVHSQYCQFGGILKVLPAGLCMIVVETCSPQTVSYGILNFRAEDVATFEKNIIRLKGTK